MRLGFFEVAGDDLDLGDKKEVEVGARGKPIAVIADLGG
jgi:hypothetical protein